MDQQISSLFAYLSDHWPVIEMHKDLFAASLLLGCLLGFVMGYWFYKRQLDIADRQLTEAHQRLGTAAPVRPAASKIETALVLRYSGGDDQPEHITDANLHRWFSLENRAVFLSPTGESKTAIITALLWIFDCPTNYKQPLVSFSGGVLPGYEVKDNTNRYILLAFSGRIPKGVLELSLKQ